MLIADESIIMRSKSGVTQSVIIKDTEKVKRVSDEKSASVKCVDTVI